MALAGCALVSAIFALHYAIAREILDSGVSPYALSSWRGIVGGALILLYFKDKLELRHVKTNFLPLLMVAFLGFFINQIFFMKGLKLTSTVNVALLSNTLPIISLLFALVTGQERATPPKIAGVTISFFLICYLILGNSKASSIEFLNLGNTLILLNVLAFCGAFIVGKRLLNKDFPFELLAGKMLLGGGILMLLMAKENMLDIPTYSALGLKEFLYVTFEIIISTSMAYLLNIWTLKQLDVTKVTFFIYIQPMIASIATFFMHGTTPAPQSWLIYAGIILSGFMVLRPKSVKKIV